MKKDLKQFTEFLFGHNRRLNRIIRFNTRHKISSESVAAHSFYVALYALILADIMKEHVDKIDKEKVLIYALLHDMEECVSGDVVRTFKKRMIKAYDELTQESINTIFDRFPEHLKTEYINNWKNNDKGLEGLIVQVADDLSGLVYCIEEINMGNNYFKLIRDSYMKGLKIKMQVLGLDNFYSYLDEAIKSKDKTLDPSHE